MSQLLTALRSIKGATPVTFIAETTPRLKGGKKCPYQGVVKRARLNAMLGSEYETKVNRQREKEGGDTDFQAESTWGQHETPSLIELRGEHYLQVLNPNYLEVEYFLNGKPVGESEIKEWIPEKKPSRQEVEDEVKCLRYSVKRIKQITINGNVYTGEEE